jgi:ubiquinone/menaquinone biosynthesis C-methylase UbiE
MRETKFCFVSLDTLKEHSQTKTRISAFYSAVLVHIKYLKKVVELENEVIPEPYVHESKFGKWFLRSRTWTDRVLDVALDDLETLFIERKTCYPVVVDVGCGYGHSLVKLHQRFSPQKLIGLDIDKEMLSASQSQIDSKGLDAKLIYCSSSNIPLEDSSVDLLFCHQTFHHIIKQEEAIKEFYRVLKPDGVFLFAESTKRYIHSFIIRLLFRHPMHVQKTAEEYLSLIQSAGFVCPQESISYPFLWWSREDLGIKENVFGMSPGADREETLINLIASKNLI